MSPKMVVILLGVVSSLSVAFCVEDSKVQCVNDLVQWCNDTEQNTGVSIITTTSSIRNMEYIISCVRDTKSGTKCTKNGDKWFSCSPQGALLYDDRQLTQGSTEGVDDDVCSALEFVNGNGLKFDRKAFDAGMDRLKSSMDSLKEKMKNMRDRMSGSSWPFERSFGKDFV